MEKWPKAQAYKIFRIIPILLGFVLSGGGNAPAAPSNGTVFPAKGGFESGYEYNIIFKRPLARSYGHLESQNNFYALSYGVSDWFALDGKIGFGNTLQKGGTHLPKIDYNTAFAGGYGFRIKALDEKKWGFRAVAGFQHICVHPQDRSIDDNKFESILDDWQASAVFSKNFKLLNPYAGIKFSDCEQIYKINDHDKKRRFSRYHVGLITGLEAHLLKDRLRVSAEGRFFDETALSTSISYLF